MKLEECLHACIPKTEMHSNKGDTTDLIHKVNIYLCCGKHIGSIVSISH